MRLGMIPPNAAERDALDSERYRYRSLRRVLLDLVDAKIRPPRLLLGSYGLPVVEAVYEQRLQSWLQWQAASAAADGPA